MIKIKARLSLFKNTMRTMPIRTGYRPLFNFEVKSKKSGQIELVNNEFIEVGNCGDVIVNFVNSEYLGENLKLGEKIFFDEGGERLGEIEILEIY
ncbi:hypothetical protein D3C80_1084100 [compost metagenome]